MAQTYQGYFQADGRFIADDTEVAIPTMRQMIISIIDDEATETKAQKQRKAFEEFVKIVSEADPLGESFDRAMRQGIHFREELDV